MKQILLSLIVFNSITIYAQVTTTFEVVIVDSGKHEFKQQALKDTPDYSKAYRILTNQIKLNPKNAELRYFLGYTIDRLNSVDGSSMHKSRKELTIKASEQLEEANRLEPIYKGEQFILDPYSKISAIWGSLAQSFMTRKLIDSAKWAFNEGKKRGGFQEPILEFNRQLLSSCDSSAILVTNGDNITFPIWYLQIIENFRNDITPIDGSLIGAAWYAKHLKNESDLKMSLSSETIDTIGYIEWSSRQIEIVNPQKKQQKFNWELRPTYYNNYLLKGDRILLDILQQNLYRRPFYFCIFSDTTFNLFLSSHFKNEGLVDRVTIDTSYKADESFVISPNLYAYNIDKLSKDDIAKSRDAIGLLNYMRWIYTKTFYHLTLQNRYDKAKELAELMKTKFNKTKLPFPSKEEEDYFDDYIKLIEEL